MSLLPPWYNDGNHCEKCSRKYSSWWHSSYCTIPESEVKVKESGLDPNQSTLEYHVNGHSWSFLTQLAESS